MCEQLLKNAKQKAYRHPDSKFTRKILDATYDGLVELIEHRFDPHYQSPTIRDMSQIPAEDLEVTPEDIAELEALPEQVKNKLKTLLHLTH